MKFYKLQKPELNFIYTDDEMFIAWLKKLNTGITEITRKDIPPGSMVDVSHVDGREIPKAIEDIPEEK